MRRLALYIFWERHGVVRDVVEYYLKELQKVSADILVIVTGAISDESKNKFGNIGVKILTQADAGSDFLNWKNGLEYIGWNNVSEYDELILTNCTCYGPIFPFQAMFDIMNLRNCDFWGINRHPNIDIKRVHNDPKRVVNEHLQSYFMVFRSQCVKSSIFKEYWDKLPSTHAHDKATGYYETIFTTYMKNSGFRSDTYMDFDKYTNLVAGDASLILADKQLIEDSNPLVKKELMSSVYHTLLNKSFGEQGCKVLDFTANNTSYDVNMIWDDLLATQKMSDIKTALHLSRILPSNVAINSTPVKAKIALVMHIYYANLVDYCYSYALSMPNESDIFIVTPNDSVKTACDKKFAQSPFNTEIRIMPNRGRDNAAYMVVCADIFKEYDYVCCMHDKKTPSAHDRVVGQFFAMHCFENNLKNADYVRNIINLFDNEPRLGMVAPPIPQAALYYGLLGSETRDDLENMRALHKRLNFTIPLDDAVFAPYGSMFWVRGRAFAPMFNHQWQYEDFPEEPVCYLGTLLHAMERIYAHAVQQAGYYVVTCAPDTYAAIYSDNLIFELRNMNNVIYARTKVRESFVETINDLNLLLKTFGMCQYFKKVAQFIFQLTIVNEYKIITIFGCKIKMKRKQYR